MECEEFEMEEPAKSAFKLRPYQQECVDAIIEGWKTYSRLLAVLCTGGGKTVIFSMIALREVQAGGRVLILAHTDELLEQAIDKIRRATGLEADKEKADNHASPYAQVVVASIQTLSRTNRLTGFADNHFSLVITDECFPAGTLVGEIPIELIAVGDFVPSYNHSTGRVERRKVNRVFKKRPSVLIAVVISSGKRIVCSPEHPFYTQRGYVAAKELTSADSVYESPEVFSLLRQDTQERALPLSRNRVLQEVRESAPKGAEDHSGIEMQGVRETCYMQREKTMLQEPSGSDRKTGLLLGEMPRYGDVCSSPEISSVAFLMESNPLQRENESREPDVQSEDGSENDEIKEGADIFITRRKRTANEATDRPSCTASVPDNGASDFTKGTQVSLGVSTDLLQGGFGAPWPKVGNRSGRPQSLSEKMEVLGPPKDGHLNCIGVVRVEFLESGGGSRYSAVCRDGFIYNIEVEGNNNYFAEGVLVHNCHRSLAKSYDKVLRYFHFGAESLAEGWKMPAPEVSYQHKARCLGVTATPDRADKRSLGEFYQKCVFDYGLLEACRDGYLVRPIVKQIPLKLDLRGVKKTAGDYDAGQIVERITPFLDLIAKTSVPYMLDRKSVIFTPSVETARIMADMLRKYGIDASFVSGQCPDRHEKIEAYHAKGNGSAVCNAMLLTEGWDHDEASLVMVLRVTKIPSLFKQCVGRCTRTLTGVIDGLETREERLAAIAASAKKDMLILDYLWLTDKLDLVGPADLVTTNPIVKESIVKSGVEDLLAAEQEGQKDLLKSLEKEAKKHQHRHARTLDPIAWAVSLGDDVLAAYTPETEQEARPATKGELDFLLQAGIETQNIKSSGQAQKFIARILDRDKMGLASPKQLQLLLRLGMQDETASLMTKKQAGAIIGRAQEKWSAQRGY